MKYSMYLDESGNTGNPKLKEKGWNFREQPNYGLGSISIKTKFKDEIEKDILKLFSKYDSEIGVTKELKSTTDYWFNNDLFIELVSLLDEYNTIFYFDIIGKRFNIVKYLVHYCLYPESIIDFDESHIEEKVNFTSIVSNNIEDELLNDFITLCELETEHENLRGHYLTYLHKLKENVMEKSIKNRIEKSIEIFIDEDISINRIIPMEDFTNRGRLMRLLPNIDSFNNVVFSISTLKLSSKDSLRIYHDVQEQFGQSYERWMHEATRLGKTNIDGIEFVKSDECILIQTIDFLIGNLLKLYERTINCNHLKRRDRELGKKVKTLLYNTNIVSTKHKQNKFFTSHSIKYSRTSRPL